MDQPKQLQAKVLTRAKSPDEYRVYRAALEWDLIDPIVIDSRDDLKSEYRWQERIEPYHHQVTNLITFCRRLPVTLLADDVGLGKTISAGLIVSELAARSRVSKVLVVCPKLLGPQWKEELETKFDIAAKVVTGNELRHADLNNGGAIITTYHSARLYLDDIPPDRFEMLILDEAHKLRNLYGTDNPPQVAQKFRKALADRRFRYVLMLTATPIQNRLWDLYSLVDLLTVARGHQNPFGSEGMFARRFIDDGRDTARRLKLDAKEAFQSIVYGYMSRVRRGDAKLYFPDRVVQMHRVAPSSGEVEIIDAIAEPIQLLNRLAQISILQALTSSPEALDRQLRNMAQKGSIPTELATEVHRIVQSMPRPAKLHGLEALVNKLRAESADRWRLVVFTGRLETQTSIEVFLSELGLKVGLINGSTGARNQDTLKAFRADPPELNVIVSTEAGSEGVNLQAANVLVNYDLPWNPMIVEQRIGRIQRLASEHARVAIYNVILGGTFEEYIVGRLMEKLQLATHAIGDIESLLEASGVSDEDNKAGFEERIRELVVAALAGKDTQAAMRLADESIDRAKDELERERENIDTMLGNMEGAEHFGPRAPDLPPTEHSMEPKAFVLESLRMLGAHVTPLRDDVFLLMQNGSSERIAFEHKVAEKHDATLYAPGSAAFSKLVTRIGQSGAHDIVDRIADGDRIVSDLCRDWLSGFGGQEKSIEVVQVTRMFAGKAMIRVHATVQHDSFERLVDVECKPSQHRATGGKALLVPIKTVIDDIGDIGIASDAIIEAVERDEPIAEFCRFYLERREIEVRAAGEDERQRHKLSEDFTPRLQMTMVGLSGAVGRRAEVKVSYFLDGNHTYESALTLNLFGKTISVAPELHPCTISGQIVPSDCLGRCEFTNSRALRHLMVQSELSGRLSLPKFSARCSVSKRQLLKDEVIPSDVTGALVAQDLIRTCGVTGKRAEPDQFGICEFTGDHVLKSALVTSEISGKRFRSDQLERSAVSGKVGHKSEFIVCHETRQLLAPQEAETCDITGKYVRPGILEECAQSHKRVLPSELEECTYTGKRVLRSLLVESSVSQRRLLASEAVRSIGGAACAPNEVQTCIWSSRRAHPDDVQSCNLTGLQVHVEYLSSGNSPALVPLEQLVGGILHTRDRFELWEFMEEKIALVVGGRCQIEAAVLSPNENCVAVRCSQRRLLGLRRAHIGAVYSREDDAVLGRTCMGRP